MSNEEKDKMHELERAIAEMIMVQRMIANAPQDDKGNVVVDIVGIKQVGLFYLFKN